MSEIVESIKVGEFEMKLQYANSGLKPSLKQKIMQMMPRTHNGEIPTESANEMVDILTRGNDLDIIEMVFRANDTAKDGALGRAETKQFLIEQAALRNQSIPEDALGGMVDAAFAALN